MRYWEPLRRRILAGGVLFVVGLLPALLTLYIRAFIPESPHWLLRRGRLEEARRSLAWALMIDPREIALPTVPILRGYLNSSSQRVCSTGELARPQALPAALNLPDKETGSRVR
jgi:hypothetical protein